MRAWVLVDTPLPTTDALPRGSELLLGATGDIEPAALAAIAPRLRRGERLYAAAVTEPRTRWLRRGVGFAMGVAGILLVVLTVAVLFRPPALVLGAFGVLLVTLFVWRAATEPEADPLAVGVTPSRVLGVPLRVAQAELPWEWARGPALRVTTVESAGEERWELTLRAATAAAGFEVTFVRRSRVWGVGGVPASARAPIAVADAMGSV